MSGTRVVLVRHGHVPEHGVAGNENGDVLHDGIGIERDGRPFGASHHVADAPQDIAGPAIIVDDVGDDFAEISNRRPSRVDETPGAFSVVQNTGERLAELVRERGRQFAHARQPGQMGDLLPGPLHLDLGLLACRRIGQHFGHDLELRAAPCRPTCAV